MHFVVVVFNFLCCKVFVEVVARLCNDVNSLGGVVLALVLVGIEDNVAEKVGEFVLVHAFGCIHCNVAVLRLFEQHPEIFLGELRCELVVGIVVVDAICKPYLLKVYLEVFPVLAFLVAFVGSVNTFQSVTNHQVVLEELVVEDVASPVGGFGQIIYELFLL